MCSTTEHINRLRRRNASMASTRVFPAEILSYIFSYVLHDVEREECHRQCDFVRLGHICSEWRDIIISTPLLWSKFRVDISKELYEETPLSKAVPYFPLLLLYVNNSGNCSFHLDVVFPSRFYFCTTQEILQQLQRYVPNVHTLTIKGMTWVPKLLWSSWLSVKDLRIHWRAYGYKRRDISFAEFTCLRSLTIHHQEFPVYMQLPGEQITSLELYNAEVDICMSLLLQCPNLVKFRAYNSNEPGPDNDYVPKHPEPTQNVEELLWSFQSHSACNSLYHQLRFPSLRNFSWFSPIRNQWEDEEMSALHSLVSNFPPTVSRLHLADAVRWPDDFTEFLFANMRNLKKVDIDHCDPSVVIHFLSLLNRMSDWGGCCFLPLLAEVRIAIDYEPGTKKLWENKIASYLVPLFHLRDPHKTSQFSLEIWQYHRKFSRKLRKASVSLREDGYAFDIWKDERRRIYD